MSKYAQCLAVFVGMLVAFAPLADEMRFPDIVGADIPGVPQLGPPFLVMAGEAPVRTEKHGLAAPALWDWDGDGKRDLLVGEFETNSEDFPMGAEGSSIRVHRNIGTDASPKFGAGFTWARDTQGTIMEVPQWCCIGFTPFFFDLDADGRKDIITGQYHPGEVTWFRGAANGFLPGVQLPQEGDPASNGLPQFGDYEGEPGDIGTFDYWAYSSASFGDFDDDGDLDLILGGVGGLRISENIGGRQRPSFAERRLLLDVNGEPLRVLRKPASEHPPADMSPPPDGDGKTNPVVVDWNGDGVLDLLVTASYRHPASQAVTFFRGVKTSAGHRFHSGVDLLATADGAKALPGSGPRVYVDDWNRDGVQDLIIGASVATVNDGEFSDELSWEWEDVTGVESAGKDPGLYPPRPKPTAESLQLARLRANGMSEKEAEELLAFNVEYWEDTIGRLYKEGKEHWLTMRHQGRVYVMLGSRPEDASAALPPPANSAAAIAAAPTAPAAPVRVAVEATEHGGRPTLQVRFAMRDGWYVYAPTGRNAPHGMTETNVAFDLPPAVSLAGDLVLPPHHYKGVYDIYEGSVTWRQPVAVTDTADEQLPVTARVTYQTCKDDLCLPPRTETLRTTIGRNTPSGEQRANSG